MLPAAGYRGYSIEGTQIALLRAGAFENIEYVIGVGNCASQFIGRRCVVGPDGSVDCDLGRGDSFQIEELDKERLFRIQESSPLISKAMTIPYVVSMV